MLEDVWKRLIRDTVRKYLPDKSYKIFIFGSRAQAKNQKWSDVDVGILGPDEIPAGVHIQIEEELENSDIPYKVDVVDFKTVSQNFAKISQESIINL